LSEFFPTLTVQSMFDLRDESVPISAVLADLDRYRQQRSVLTFVGTTPPAMLRQARPLWPPMRHALRMPF